MSACGKRICRTDWPKLLQEITFIHNVQVNASTGISLNEVMFGTRLRTKVDAALPLAEAENVTNPTEYCETAREEQLNVRKSGWEHG